MDGFKQEGACVCGALIAVMTEENERRRKLENISLQERVDS